MNNSKLSVKSIDEIIKNNITLLFDASKVINEQKLLLATTGVLNFDFTKINDKYDKYYDVPLRDIDNHDKNLLLNIPKMLIDKFDITGGELVNVIGYTDIRFFKNQFTIRLQVVDITVDSNTQEILKANKSFIESFKHFDLKKIPFPKKPAIAVITPNSGDAYKDFTTEIKYQIDILRYPCNILSKDAVLNTLNSIDKNFNIVIIIRGGGSDYEFNIFDDIDICKKFAQMPVHKVIGLGHSSNRTLLELVSDAVGQTPTAVGRYINNSITKKPTIYNNSYMKDSKVVKQKSKTTNVLIIIIIIFLNTIAIYYFDIVISFIQIIFNKIFLLIKGIA